MLFVSGLLTVLFGALFYSFHIFAVNKVFELLFFVCFLSLGLTFWYFLHQSGITK